MPWLSTVCAGKLSKAAKRLPGSQVVERPLPAHQRFGAFQAANICPNRQTQIICHLGIGKLDAFPQEFATEFLRLICQTCRKAGAWTNGKVEAVRRAMRVPLPFSATSKPSSRQSGDCRPHRMAVHAKTRLPVASPKAAYQPDHRCPPKHSPVCGPRSAARWRHPFTLQCPLLSYACHAQVLKSHQLSRCLDKLDKWSQAL